MTSLALLICLLAPPDPAVITAKAAGMGTDLEIKVWLADPTPAATQRAKAALHAALAEIDRVEGLMSEWRPDSDVSRINLAAGGAPVPISAETMFVLRRARDISERTGGAFDVTWRGIGGLWDFRAGEMPSPAAARLAARRVHYRRLELDPAARTARLARPDMAIGLGGIAKGFAVDAALAVLAARGLRDAVVTAGGDLRVMGSKGEAPWRVGLRDPRGPGDFASLEVRDMAVVSSGDYERYFERDGRRYHHILDPFTGYPAMGAATVIVLAPDAMSADAWATGLFVLGPRGALALVEATADLEAVIVDTAGHTLVSSGLRDRIRFIPQGPAAPR